MYVVEKVPTTPTNRNQESTTKMRGDKKMKQDKVIRLTGILQKKSLHAGGAFLAAVALFFASAPCLGHFYEPEVPEQLR